MGTGLSFPFAKISNKGMISGNVKWYSFKMTMMLQSYLANIVPFRVIDQNATRSNHSGYEGRNSNLGLEKCGCNVSSLER